MRQVIIDDQMHLVISIPPEYSVDWVISFLRVESALKIFGRL
jgi:hypothetical protein